MMTRNVHPVAAVVCLAVVGQASAAVPRDGVAIAADTLTAMPGAKLSKPLRVAAQVRWHQAAPSSAWQRFAATGAWQAAWDNATGVPRRIWGSGVGAPGAVASAAVAEAVARGMLASHIDLLAPGSAPSDFVLVSNRLDGDIRAVGFAQTASGYRVVGGQVSFLFKRDRLIVIGSEALPDVEVVVPKAALAWTAPRMHSSLRSAVALASAPVSLEGADVILPLVGDDAVVGYRVVTPMSIDGGAEGRYTGYLDPATGQVIALVQKNQYATATLLYRGVDRYPGRGRIDRPATRAHVTVNSVPTITSPTGLVTWTPETQAGVQTSIVGDLVSVVNKATDGGAASARLLLDPGGQAIWDASGVDEDDAQVIAYLGISLAKDYVRTHLDPTMATLDQQLTVNVNIDQGCNAFFDGTSVNFFRRTNRCENTGRLEDVVLHEYGHRIHTAEIVAGVGAFDAAMSEGVADFFAASVIGDPGVGRGFNFTDVPLRDLDPPDMEWTWPRDIGEIHRTGMIYGGIFWDLRKQFIADFGHEAGVALVNKLFVGSMRYAADIPSSLVAALAVDDDDGDLSNGTPHECAIRAAFGSHGVATASGSVAAPGRVDGEPSSVGITVDITGAPGRCLTDQLIGASLSWQVGSASVPARGSVEAVPVGPFRFAAQLPVFPNETMLFTVSARFLAGPPLTLADNPADSAYQLYAGRTEVLYCTDFENGSPFATGWSTATADGKPSPWQWGMPTSGKTDPHRANSGARVLSLGLDSDYSPKQNSWVEMPEVDVGNYSDVRLQYWRHLAVEDSHFDQARITANDVVVWQNHTADNGDMSSLHHIDRQWRFHDVPLSSRVSDRKLRVAWSLRSDEGLNLGGWALDDVCIVANPNSICGDGITSSTEQCDDGMANADAPDKCRTRCRLPACGDRIVDDAEQCDAGPDGSADCSSECKTVAAASGGCRAVDETGTGVWSLGGLSALFLMVRRRRRAVSSQLA